MKSNENLNQLKDEYENLIKKLYELTNEELKTVIGGAGVNPDVLKALVGTSQRGIGINPDEQEMIAKQNPKAIATGVIMKAVCGSIDKAAIKK